MNQKVSDQSIEVELGNIGLSADQTLSNIETPPPDQEIEVQQVNRDFPKAKSTSSFCKLLKVIINIGVWTMPSEFSKSYLTGGFVILILAGLTQYYSWDLIFTCLDQKTKYNKLIPQTGMIQQVTIGSISSAKASISKAPSRFSTYRDSSNFEEDDDDEEEEMKIENVTFYRPLNIIELIGEIYPNKAFLYQSVRVMNIILFQGSSIATVIILLNTLTLLEPELGKYWYKLPILFFFSILLLFFSQYRFLEQIKSQIYIADYITLGLVYFVFSLSVYQIKLNSESDTPLTDFNYGINWQHASAFFGVALFAYDANSQISEIRKEMNHPQKFKTVLRITVFVIFLIYGVLGFIGASAYRNKTRRLILDNVYDTTVEIGKGIKIIYLSLRVMFIQALVVNLTMKNIIGTQLFSSLVLKKWPKLNQYKHRHWILQYLFIAFYIIFASYLQDITWLLSLLGSISIVYLGFVIPYIAYQKMFKFTMLRIIVNTFVLVFGVFGGITSIISLILTIQY